jgi:2,4-dienoyl-CoA reductase-like NADH-dependent reductase (Old Yellow Enzyme family)
MPVEKIEPANVLFEPLAMNSLTIPNRIVLSPMAVLEPHRDGRPSRQTIAFLCERARGGAGLIIVGGTASTRRMYEERPYGAFMRLDDDRFLPELQRLTDAVHRYETPVVAQLMAGFGPMAKSSSTWPLIAASPKNIVMKRDRFPRGILVPADRATATPRAATVAEIRQLEQEVATTALRCYRAGFDGVELAAQMSYFLASFLSPRTNWRTDEYGGSIENRARILVNIVRLIRQRVGASFPVGLRITANEHVDGGQGPQEYAAIAQHVEREGLDYVALCDGKYESLQHTLSETEAATVVHGEAHVFRAALSCPIILGNIRDPMRAVEVIASGHGDAVMFARQMLADPQYANKIRNHRTDEIVRCDHGNGCMRRLVMSMPVRCTLNPQMGRESRPSGARPPIQRLVRAPLEQVVLWVTGSKRLVSLVGRLTSSRS